MPSVRGQNEVRREVGIPDDGFQELDEMWRSWNGALLLVKVCLDMPTRGVDFKRERDIHYMGTW
jgi:hypothetical protein